MLLVSPAFSLGWIILKVILENMFKISKRFYVLLMTVKKQQLLELVALEIGFFFFLHWKFDVNILKQTGPLQSQYWKDPQKVRHWILQIFHSTSKSNSWPSAICFFTNRMVSIKKTQTPLPNVKINTFNRDLWNLASFFFFFNLCRMARHDCQIRLLNIYLAS